MRWGEYGQIYMRSSKLNEYVVSLLGKRHALKIGCLRIRRTNTLAMHLEYK